jgi:hypothetical protein
MILQYRQNPSVSQSRLVNLDKGIGSYKRDEKYFEEKSHFLKGDAFDVLMTSDNFNELFYISAFADKPGTGAMSVVKFAFDRTEQYCPLSDCREFILEGCKLDKYGGETWEDDRKFNDIVKKGEVYWEDLWTAKGKTVLSDSEYTLADSQKVKVLEHPFTSFIQKLRDNKNVTSHKQFPVYWEYRGLSVKSLIDELFINNGGDLQVGEIFIPEGYALPIDYKTPGDSVKAFPSSVKRFRYDVQGAFYRHAVGQLGLNCLPLHFIVVSPFSMEPPLVYRLHPTDEAIGRWGAYNQGQYIPSVDIGEPFPELLPDLDVNGYEQMITRYLWHQENNQWEYDKEIFLSNGLMNMQVWT